MKWLYSYNIEVLVFVQSTDLVYLNIYFYLSLTYTFNKLWKSSKEKETLAYSSHNDAMLGE